MTPDRQAAAPSPAEATKPATTNPSAAPGHDHRRTVRIFVALHLTALGVIYALAVTMGGGLAGPPMPPEVGAAPLWQPAQTAISRMPTTQMSIPAPGPDLPATRPSPAIATALPAWTQRAEMVAPWELR